MLCVQEFYLLKFLLTIYIPHLVLSNQSEQIRWCILQSFFKYFNAADNLLFMTLFIVDVDDIVFSPVSLISNLMLLREGGEGEGAGGGGVGVDMGSASLII